MVPLIFTDLNSGFESTTSVQILTTLTGIFYFFIFPIFLRYLIEIFYGGALNSALNLFALEDKDFFDYGTVFSDFYISEY